MKAFILPTKNIMTTAFYYSLLKKIFEKAGFDEVILCDSESLKGYDVDRRKDFIMTGNPYPTLRLKAKGYRRVGTWYQGCGPEERKMQGSSWLHIKMYALMEMLVLKLSSFHLFVSKALLNHYQEKYKIRINESKYAIMPCFNDKEAHENCFRADVKKKYSFVYSGGMGVWQCFCETLDVFKLVKQRLPEATLDVYTYEEEKARAVVKENGIEGVIVRYIPKDKMGNALADKMFGFVLRGDDPVNRVATPTKLSNYEAYGVIPVCSSVVEDFTKATEYNRYVIHVDGMDVNSIANEVYERVIQIVQSYSPEDHMAENCRLFDTYYCENKYIGIISAKLNYLFSLG